MIDKTKKCSVCKQEKHIESFNINNHVKDGRAYECKDCRKKLRKLKGFKSLEQQPLTDNYIKMLLANDIKDLIIKIPYELIELKREEIRINRELLRIKNGSESN